MPSRFIRSDKGVRRSESKKRGRAHIKMVFVVTLPLRESNTNLTKLSKSVGGSVAGLKLG